MNGGTDPPLRAGKCALEMRMSDKAGVDWLPPTLLVYKSGSRGHLALNTAVALFSSSLKQGPDC